MAEYICREEAIEAIRQTYCPNCDSCNGIMCKACGYKDCMDIVDDVKAADVQPDKHGRWECVGHDDTTYWYRCSICGHEEHDNMTKHDNYCSNCGARMDLDSVTHDRCSNYMDCDGNCFIDDTPCDCNGNIEKCKGR